MQKVIIYPFEAKDVALALQLKTYKDVYLEAVCTYPGSGLSGKDLSFADARNNSLEIVINDNFDDALNNSDVLIVPPTQNENLYPLIDTAIKKAFSLGKDAIDMATKSDSEVDFFNKLSTDNNAKYRCIRSEDVISKINQRQSQGKMMFSLPVPVIFIGGVTPTGVDEFVFTLVNFFKENDVVATCLGESNIYSFLNFYCYDSILKSHLAEEEKMRELNLLSRYAYERSNPDIMIIQLPGITSKYNECITGDFGVYTYMFSQIFSPDYFIFTAIYGLYDNDSYDKLSEYFNRKFGFEIDGVHLSNEIIDSEESIRNETIRYTKINMEKVDEFINKENIEARIPIYNLFNQHDFNKLYDNIKYLFNIK